ncbi:MAG: amino acid ABC transporter permease [Erysipelotrichaceae bacterium]|nr:amino acid ABC transporter permease [Erysipelotrichaceae bacterium]
MLTIINNSIKMIAKFWDVFLIKGLYYTLSLSLIAVFFGAIIGSLLAMIRISKLKIAKAFVSAYVEIIRGTPILLQLYFFYLVLPNLISFMNPSKFTCIAISLIINSSAYVSEVVRSGIQAVDKGQMEASRSLGLNQSQTMRRIILPQAIRNILPALGNEFIMIIKETSLASTFFIGDLMSAYRTVSGATYLVIEPLLFVGVIYFVLTFTLSKVVSRFERRLHSSD